jgi:hypothetical protein
MIGPELVRRARAIAAGAGRPDAELLAVGWATVELDRAAAELGGGPLAWADGPRDALLGARVRIAAADAPAGVALVLLEPDTEGRIAAALARHGEGVVAAWVRATDDEDDAPDGRVGWSAASVGPFGRERLRLGPARGPHLLSVRADG